MKTCINCVTEETCKFNNSCEIEDEDYFDDYQQNKELDFISEDDSLDDLLDEDKFIDFNDDLDNDE
jgi:hypothetical protein